MGVFVETGADNLVEGLLIDDLGDPNAGNDWYDGFGVTMSNSGGSEIKDCFVADTEAEGLTLKGSNMKISSCQLYATKEYDTVSTLGGMDYGILVTTSGPLPATGNVVEYCKAEQRTTDGSKIWAGHGFTLATNKDDPQNVTDNKIVHCTALGVWKLD